MHHSPRHDEQLVEIIGRDALRVVLTHFHKVVFNCLYQKSEGTLELFPRKKHLHLTGKRKVTWLLDRCENRESSPAS